LEGAVEVAVVPALREDVGDDLVRRPAGAGLAEDLEETDAPDLLAGLGAVPRLVLGALDAVLAGLGAGHFLPALRFLRLVPGLLLALLGNLRRLADVLLRRLGRLQDLGDEHAREAGIEVLELHPLLLRRLERAHV